MIKPHVHFPKQVFERIILIWISKSLQGLFKNETLLLFIPHKGVPEGRRNKVEFASSSVKAAPVKGSTWKSWAPAKELTHIYLALNIWLALAHMILTATHWAKLKFPHLHARMEVRERSIPRSLRAAVACSLHLPLLSLVNGSPMHSSCVKQLFTGAAYYCWFPVKMQHNHEHIIKYLSY